MAGPADKHNTNPTITTRTALILLISLLASLGTIGLLLLSGRHPAETLIAGIAVFIATIKLMHQCITDDRTNRSTKR